MEFGSCIKIPPVVFFWLFSGIKMPSFGGFSINQNQGGLWSSPELTFVDSAPITPRPSFPKGREDLWGLPSWSSRSEGVSLPRYLQFSRAVDKCCGFAHRLDHSLPLTKTPFGIEHFRLKWEKMKKRWEGLKGFFSVGLSWTAVCKCQTCQIYMVEFQVFWGQVKWVWTETCKVCKVFKTCDM